MGQLVNRVDEGDEVDGHGGHVRLDLRQSTTSGASPPQLTLLGEPAVDGRWLGSPDSSTARIVVYLALHGTTTRARLATALWPEVADRRAQGSLRTGLWRLHRVLRGLVQTGTTLVGLRPDLSIDYHELTQAGRAMLLHPADERHDPANGYPELLRLATAELLPGWDQEWIIHERERFRQLRLHVLESLSVHLCRQGVYGMALEAALTALGCDPLRESAHRAVIEVHLAEGNIWEARRQYLACLRILRTELGLPPSHTILELGRRFGATVTSHVHSTRGPVGIARQDRSA
jgi:DNA-binding SARP family transcriptional activator